MYRLMVVEDEERIRKGIVKSIPWNELGFEVVAESKNGKEALEIMGDRRVEVLLTDIKMPFMGGIELSQKARRLYPEIEIIVLSGFSDFEYAREAISFRAFDYLLKPTNKKKLLDAFSRLKIKMDQKKEQKEEVFHSNIYRNAGYQTLRDEFLRSMLEGDKSIYKNFDKKSASLEMEFSGDFFIAATIRFDKSRIFEELSSAWATDKRLLTFSYSNIIKEALGSIDNAYYLIDDHDEINFIFCFTDKEDQRMLIPCLESICENIHNCLFKARRVPYVIGVGLSYPSIHHIAKSHTQASKSIQNNFYSGDQSIQVYHDQKESNYEQNYIMNYPEEIEYAAAAISNGQFSDAEKYLRTMFHRLMDQKLVPEIVKNYCISLKHIVQSKVIDSFEELDEIIGEDYNDLVKEALTVKALRSYVVDVMVSLAKKIDETVGKDSDSEQEIAVGKAKLYIEEHLSEKINLKMISDHVFLSETYFSFLFKKVTGSTYIDYIQKLRMKKAKELLANTSYKVYKIAELIGYNDYKYFSVQFKKYILMTPKEYRALNRKEIN